MTASQSLKVGMPQLIALCQVSVHPEKHQMPLKVNARDARLACSILLKVAHALSVRSIPTLALIALLVCHSTSLLRRPVCFLSINSSGLTSSAWVKRTSICVIRAKSDRSISIRKTSLKSTLCFSFPTASLS